MSTTPSTITTVPIPPDVMSGGPVESTGSTSPLDFSSITGHVKHAAEDVASWYLHSVLGHALTQGPPVEQGAADLGKLGEVAKGERPAESGTPFNADMTPGPDEDAPHNRPFKQFRQGLNNMATDMHKFADSHASQLSPAARALLHESASGLEQVPVGSNLAETAAVLPLGHGEIAGKLTRQAEEVAEKYGLKYRGEVSPGTGVHDFKAPDGGSLALKSEQLGDEKLIQEKLAKRKKEIKPEELHPVAQAKAVKLGPGGDFYSSLEHAAATKLPDKMSGEQLLGTLQNAGVSKRELEHSGLSELAKKDSVTKAEILDHLGKTVPQVETIEKNNKVGDDEINHLNTKAAGLNESLKSSLRNELGVTDHQAANLLTDHFSGNPSQPWKRIGKTEQDWNKFLEKHFDELNDYDAVGKKLEVIDETQNNNQPKYESYALPGGDNYREVLLQVKGSDTGDAHYHGPHFDEPNVVAHLRLKDRTDVNGKKTLFIEELQSDWARDLREQRQTEGITQENRRPPEPDDLVPEMPFDSSWHELALKKALHLAAKEGYDQIAWTTGEQQAERYNLRDKIEQLSVHPKANGRYNLVAHVKDKAMPHYFYEQTPAEMEKIIGKENTQKLLASKDGRLRPDNFAMGGEHHLRLYDEMVPQFLNKYTKKWGGEVGETQIKTKVKEPNPHGAPWSEDGLVKVQSLPITPELREGIKRGQPLLGQGTHDFSSLKGHKQVATTPEEGEPEIRAEKRERTDAVAKRVSERQPEQSTLKKVMNIDEISKEGKLDEKSSDGNEHIITTLQNKFGAKSVPDKNGLKGVELPFDVVAYHGSSKERTKLKPGEDGINFADKGTAEFWGENAAEKENEVNADKKGYVHEVRLKKGTSIYFENGPRIDHSQHFKVFEPINLKEEVGSQPKKSELSDTAAEKRVREHTDATIRVNPLDKLSGKAPLSGPKKTDGLVAQKQDPNTLKIVKPGHLQQFPSFEPGKRVKVGNIVLSSISEDKRSVKLKSESGELLGTVELQGTVTKGGRSGNLATTENLLVHPQFWRQGVATKLYEGTFDKAKRLGFDGVQSAPLVSKGGQALWKSLKDKHPTVVSGSKTDGFIADLTQWNVGKKADATIRVNPRDKLSGKARFKTGPKMVDSNIVSGVKNGKAWGGQKFSGLNYAQKLSQRMSDFQDQLGHEGYATGPKNANVWTKYKPVSKELKISSLNVTQKVVDPDAVKNIAKKTGKKGNLEPIVVVHENGKNYVVDGHHRLANMINRGDESTIVDYYDFDQKNSQDKLTGKKADATIRVNPRDKLSGKVPLRDQEMNDSSILKYQRVAAKGKDFSERQGGQHIVEQLHDEGLKKVAKKVETGEVLPGVKLNRDLYFYHGVEDTESLGDILKNGLEPRSGDVGTLSTNLGDRPLAEAFAEGALLKVKIPKGSNIFMDNWANDPMHVRTFDKIPPENIEKIKGPRVKSSSQDKLTGKKPLPRPQ